MLRSPARALRRSAHFALALLPAFGLACSAAPEASSETTAIAAQADTPPPSPGGWQQFPITRYTIAIDSIEANNVVMPPWDFAAEAGYSEWAQLGVRVTSRDAEILSNPSVVSCQLGNAASGTVFTRCADSVTQNGMFAQLQRQFQVGATDDDVLVGFALVNVGQTKPGEPPSKLATLMGDGSLVAAGTSGAVTLGFGSAATGLSWAAGPIIGLVSTALSFGVSAASGGGGSLIPKTSCVGGVMGNPTGGYSYQIGQTSQAASDSMSLDFKVKDLEALTAAGPASLYYDVAVGPPPPANTSPNAWCSSNHRIHLTISRDWGTGHPAAGRSGDRAIAPMQKPISFPSIPAPVTIVPDARELDSFWPANGASITRRRWAPDATWTTETIPVAQTLTTATPIASISRKPGYLDVYFVGEDGSVGMAYTQGGGWNYFSLTGAHFAPPHAPITAVARSPIAVDVAVVDVNGVAWRFAWSDGAPWSMSPISYGAIAKPGAGIAMVARTPDLLDVFLPNKYGTLVSYWWTTGGSWTLFDLPSTAPLPTNANVTAVARLSNALDVFAIDTNGNVNQWSWMSGLGGVPWGTGTIIASGGMAGGDVSSVSHSPDGIELAFASVARINEMRCAYGAPRCQWSAPTPIPFVRADATFPWVPFSVVSRSTDNVDLFFEDLASQRFMSSWWTGQMGWQTWAL